MLSPGEAAEDGEVTGAAYLTITETIGGMTDVDVDVERGAIVDGAAGDAG
ncbi:hypothetical protein [Microbacterium sp. NPDC056234]